MGNVRRRRDKDLGRPVTGEERFGDGPGGSSASGGETEDVDDPDANLGRSRFRRVGGANEGNSAPSERKGVNGRTSTEHGRGEFGRCENGRVRGRKEMKK